jgi:hypothetical protein
MPLDQRHLDPEALAAMLPDAREACGRAADDQGREVELRHVSSIPSIPFDDRLIERAGRAVVAYGRTVHGALEAAADGELPPRA